MSKSLRTQMPNVAAFVDGLRSAFGKDSIDGQIRKGMAGEPTFYAYENGHEIGTPLEGMSRMSGGEQGAEDGSD
jgi:hypothetical protein